MISRGGAEDADEKWSNLSDGNKRNNGYYHRGAIRINKELGPGLLESVYEEVLVYCLNKRGLQTRRQVPVAVFFDEVKMNVGFRADVIVENKVLVEIKSVELITPVHPKIVMTYLRFTKITVALMINFNVPYLRDGIKRIVNNYVPECSTSI